MYELEQALNIAKRSTSGPDNIHYEMLRHLNKKALEFILLFFNKIYDWRDIYLKPGK